MLAAPALLLGLLMLLHARIPNRIGNLGSLVETFLPCSACSSWCCRPRRWLWLNLFGELLGDKSHTGGDLTVVSRHVDADNPDPAGTARDLAASGADVLALEELTEQARGTGHGRAVGRAAAVGHPAGRHHDRPRAAGGHQTGRRQDGRQPGVMHHGDRGPGPAGGAGIWTDTRDGGAPTLGEAVTDEKNKRVVPVGDLNGTLDDRAFAGLTSQMKSARDAAGDGFGRPTGSRWHGSTSHLPVAAGISR